MAASSSLSRRAGVIAGRWTRRLLIGRSSRRSTRRAISYSIRLSKALCKKLILAGGSKLGMNKHAVGAWSLRKDACEVVARTGDGEVAARVLGHR